MWLAEDNDMLTQIEDSIILQEVGASDHSFGLSIDENNELQGLMKYNREMDENYSNFYFLNGQVISIGAFSLPRSGNFSNVHDRK